MPSGTELSKGAFLTCGASSPEAAFLSPPFILGPPRQVLQPASLEQTGGLSFSEKCGDKMQSEMRLSLLIYFENFQASQNTLKRNILSSGLKKKMDLKIKTP